MTRGEVLSDKSLLMENAEEGISASCAEEPLLLSDLEDGERRSPPNRAPGKSADHWLGLATAIGRSPQILTASVTMCLKLAPAAVLRNVRGNVSDVHGGKSKIGLATHIGARVCGLSVGAPSSMVARLCTSGWQTREAAMASAHGV